jgi:hypothetical protein
MFFLSTAILTLFALLIAYLDPVTGSFIVQAVIGGLLGGWYILKKYYNRVRTYFLGGKADSDTRTTPTDGK